MQMIIKLMVALITLSDSTDAQKLPHSPAISTSQCFSKGLHMND